MKQVAALGSLVLYALNLLLFLLPGFAVTMLMAARRSWPATRAVMMTIVVSATLGYIAFWLYFGSRLVGRFFSYGVITASIAVIAPLLRREGTLRALTRGMCVPFGYVLMTGIFYTCLLFLFKDPFTTGAEYANERFFSETLPGDNRIPLIFAERIYARQPVKPFCCGDWLSSDRPPLQAGIFLLQRPLKLFGNVRLNYQLLGTGLQCLWICGVWVLLKSLGALERDIRQVLRFLVFSGFLFYNSVFVWPKLLAATFVLFVFSILFEVARERRAITWLEAMLAALSFAVAMMAHPGSVFSVPALAAVAIWNRQFVSARKLLTGVVLIGLFIAPWIAYQKFYDPPGNRLLKMHLAGVGPIDSRSTWQAIRDSYSSLDVKTIADYKLANLRTLIGPHPFLVGPSEASRTAQREYIWSALGVLNAGWIVVALSLLRKKVLAAIPLAGMLIGVSLLNLLVWCLVLIGPGYAETEHGSYADFLLLSIGLLGFVLALPRVLTVALFALQVLNLFAIWVFVKPALISGGELQIPMLLAGVGGAVVLAWHFGPLKHEVRFPGQVPQQVHGQLR